MQNPFSGSGRLGHVALLTLAAVALADDSAAQSTEVSIQYRNRYLLPKGIVPHDGWVMQAGVKTKFYEPCYGGIWASLSLDEWVVNEDYGDELNYLAGCLGKVGPLEIDVGATYLDFISLFSTNHGDVAQFHAEISIPEIEIAVPMENPYKPGLVLRPFGRVEYAVPIKWDVPSNDGALLFGGIDTKIRLTKAWEFDVRLAAVYDTGTLDGYDNGLLHNANASLNIRPNDWFTCNVVTMFFTIPLTEVSDGRDAESAFGSGFQLNL